MRYKNNTKEIKIKPYAFRIGLMFISCSIIYYLPVIIGLIGGPSQQSALNTLHNFYGLDFYALIFFIPVVYAAYSVGVIKAVITSFLSMIIFIPYSLHGGIQVDALLRPTAFVLILSAVGAVVAMLQKGDAQRRRSMNELKCLYDIGKAAESCDSVEQFITALITIISQDLNRYGEIEVGITLRDKIYSVKRDSSIHFIREEIIIGGEAAGYVEVAYQPTYPRDRKLDHFIKTLAERIGGAIHNIELEQSLKGYYEQLEEMVENRTRELEEAHEKLIRSERLAAIGELASGVGHELRNPLSVIRNCVYLINMTLDGRSIPEVEDTLKLLDVQVDISDKIVTDLLDYTRVRAPSRSAVNLNDTVRDRVAWASIPDKIKVKYEMNRDDPMVNVDVEQVGRAFTNIINNAVQSISGEGELLIGTWTGSEYGWIKFTDTGCGIPSERLDKIFEPLFTTKPKGIGLGLAISKRMIEQNGGSIEVRSKLGEGTTFFVKLPLIREEISQYEKIGQYSRC